jgi:hypothetical protein
MAMIYEIKNGKNQIGITRFEFGDPPMGFVYGGFSPSEGYVSGTVYENLAAVCVDIDKEISCESIVIEELTDDEGVQELQVTALLSSSDEYEEYFNHHIKKYDASFK